MRLRNSFLLILLAMLSWRVPAAAANLPLPANTNEILEHIYSGRSDLAIVEARKMQSEMPSHPLGYLLEGEVLWWRIWCTSGEYKYGMTMPRHREKLATDQVYLELATKAYSLAEEKLVQQDSAEMRFYAGMADALSARLYGLRLENRATARAGVRARENLQKALALDPTLEDAYLGLGLYNYYVDTLSTIAKVLRFFMGIPGGSKEEGIRQLERASQKGQLTPVLARFYLAINLHNYDQRYEQALRVITPLVEKYPQNPLFLLARADLYGKLGRKTLAIADYRAAARTEDPDEECRKKVERLAREGLAAQGSTLQAE